MERSYLFVPGNKPERFEKAYASGADAVIIDLEDAVHPDVKEAARDNVKKWLSTGVSAVVRVNSPGSVWYNADLDVLNYGKVSSVMLPKVESSDQVEELASFLPRGVDILPVIESSLGLLNAVDIARSGKVKRLVFGSADFQLDSGIKSLRDGLLLARSHLVICSSAADIAPPVDGVTLSTKCSKTILDDVVYAKGLGFSAKLCIHPFQVSFVNHGFLPSESEVAWAEKVVSCFEAAPGCWSFSVDGKLVDKPLINKAYEIIEMHRQ